MQQEIKKEVQKSFLGHTLPMLIIAIVFVIMALHLAGVINLPDVKDKIFNYFGLETDAFTGTWQTLSPATYYSQDIDGERYAEHKANFHLTITKEGKGYLGSGWLTELTSKKVEGAIISITPPVPNPDGNGYSSPLAFDARGYLEPQPGISSLEKTDTQMIINTPLSGGNPKIVLTLNGDKLYATLSVIPTGSGQVMGEVSDSDIVLVRE